MWASRPSTSYGGFGRHQHNGSLSPGPVDTTALLLGPWMQRTAPSVFFSGSLVLQHHGKDSRRVSSCCIGQRLETAVGQARDVSGGDSFFDVRSCPLTKPKLRGLVLSPRSSFPIRQRNTTGHFAPQASC